MYSVSTSTSSLEVVRDLDPDYTIPFGRNRYCGPAALAYLLRTDPDTAAAVLRDVSGSKAIRGIYAKAMAEALARYGFERIARHHHRLHRVGISRYRTLLGWLEDETRTPGDEYLVNVTGHYIVVHGDRWFDSHCHLGKPVSNCKWLRKRVISSWLIRPRA